MLYYYIFKAKAALSAATRVLVKCRIVCIKVTFVLKGFLCYSNSFAESLIVNDFPLS